MNAGTAPEETSEQNLIDRSAALIRQAEGTVAAGDYLACRDTFDHVEYLLDRVAPEAFP